MAKKSSSKRWIHEYNTDEFVIKAKTEGYRSRAVYKLLEIITKDKIIKAGDIVLDLRAAPGSWSELAAQKVGKQGRVIANDILPIKSISNVSFLQGDFTKDEVYQKLLQLTDKKIDIVLSDMAPNMSGQLSVDMPKAMYLCELALEIALKILKKKVFFWLKFFRVRDLMNL